MVNLPIFAIRCFFDLSGNKKTKVFPARVTSELRPKTEFEIFAFAEAKANNFRNLVFYYTPYGSSQASEQHIYCCACQGPRVCLSADTGHSRGVRELNYLTLR